MNACSCWLRIAQTALCARRTEEGMEALMIFRARATRGFRMIRRSRQTVLLARRAPTMKRWSLDARSKEQSAYSFWGKSRNQKVLALANGTSWRASGRVGRLRVEEDRPALFLNKNERARRCDYVVVRRAQWGAKPNIFMSDSTRLVCITK